MELFFEIFIVFVLSFFQSVFGIGLLLFGTPTFLIFGYDFITTLVLLLPISITISFLQVIYRKSLKKSEVIEFNFYCLPLVVIFLLFTLNIDLIAIKMWVAIFLIISSLVSLNVAKIIIWENFFLKYRKFLLATIGCIHGFSNMGGGFLSIFSTIIHPNKLHARNYIAYGYLAMGIVQLAIVIMHFKGDFDLYKISYLIFPFIIFYPSQKIFLNIDNYVFRKLINFIALTYGIIALLILMS